MNTIRDHDQHLEQQDQQKQRNNNMNSNQERQTLDNNAKCFLLNLQKLEEHAWRKDYKSIQLLTLAKKKCIKVFLS